VIEFSVKIEIEPACVGATTSDNSPTTCRGDDKASDARHTKQYSEDERVNPTLSVDEGCLTGAAHKATLPREARLPINRCNLPAVVLGSLTYQQYPADLLLDGVAVLHRNLFERLEAAAPGTHAEVFRDYMTVHFRLERPEDVGFTGRKKSRAKANYIKMLRGWSFDSDKIGRAHV
jgi:NAD+--dinitrogen-reductase ADP-D-ribosyltransferase